jgi:CubicO group peptidase (beta-lactamase class C family)
VGVTDERTLRLLTARLAEHQADHRLPSVVAGLVRDGELIWSGGRGQWKWDGEAGGGTSGPSPHADVQYRAGSITKTFIAVAVLRLRDEGLLGLTDPIGQHVADAAGAAGLTVGQLLSHTSGLRAETAGPWWERTAGSPFGVLAAQSLGPDALRLRPGWQFHYSNPGYALLGELVTGLRGRPWYDVIADELLAPLHMNRTTLRPQPPHATGFAVHPHADLLLPEPEHDAEAMAPAGQLWTTVTDLARWAGFLAGVAGGELIDPATLAEMRVPAAICDVPDQPWDLGYGLGLQLWNSGGRRSYGHTGSMPGFTGALQIDSASGDAAIVLTNSTTSADGAAFTAGLLRILAENDPPVRPEWTAAGVAGDVLELVGTWYWGPMAFLVSVGGGPDGAGSVLEFRGAGSGSLAHRFRPADDGIWTGIDGYFAGELLRPVRGQDGGVVALDLASHTYTRLPYGAGAPVPGGVDPGGWRG